MGSILNAGDYKFTLSWNNIQVYRTGNDFTNIANGTSVKPLLYANEDNTVVKKTNITVNGVEYKDVFDVKLNDNPAVIANPVSHIYFSSPKGVLK